MEIYFKSNQYILHHTYLFSQLNSKENYKLEPGGKFEIPFLIHEIIVLPLNYPSLILEDTLIRTENKLCHIQLLYQLSYTHLKINIRKGDSNTQIWIPKIHDYTYSSTPDSKSIIIFISSKI